jgi:hypothetical protein
VRPGPEPDLPAGYDLLSDEERAQLVADAEAAYERLVRRYEATDHHGVHWNELSPLEQEYWTRVWLALRRVPPTP